MKKVAIIGGGPAGMTAALAAAQTTGSGTGVSLFDKNDRYGKKLLLSGSGQCNITHSGSKDEFLLCFPREQQQFLKPPLYAFFREELFALFKTCGISFIQRDDGKYFPKSMHASDLRNSLLKMLSAAGVGQKCNANVVSLAYDSGKYVLKLDDGSELAGWDAVILACGGKSYPSTGSDGSAYALASALGHKVVPPRPALADITIKDFFLSGCRGTSFGSASAELYRDGRKIMDCRGDLLVTHRGFSGPLVLNNSRYFRKGDELRMDFNSLGPAFERDFLDAVKQSGSRMLKNFLSEKGYPENFSIALLGQNGPDPFGKLAEMDKKQRTLLKNLFTAASFVIASPGDFRRAMLTAGGVSLTEINRKTMASLLLPGLFFAGEIMDIDGPGGGYNLQAAFSTGYCAGVHAAGRE
ncbi:MAG: aminoacetone oxidase family FAD-binding enzyme [Spirochaetales bacterium]|nr:aminoacetone oxidase family FAD-binding enzyme [Spirochaetales bacterium]